MPKKEERMLSSVQILLLVLALILFYQLLKPLLNIFLASVIISYIFYPVYAWIGRKTGKEAFSALAALAIIVLLFLMPLVFIASQIPAQASAAYNYAKANFIESSTFDEKCETSDNLMCKAFNLVTGSGFFEFEDILAAFFKKVSELAAHVVVKIPNSIAAVAISLIISFFLFRGGKKLLEKLIKMIPMSKSHSENLIEKFRKVTHSVVYAHIIAAIAQGALGIIGFYIFDIPSPIFWGVLMSIFALLPMVGPAIIWLPASLLKIINGMAMGSYWELAMGIGLLAYGFFIISTIDNLLRIKIIGDKGDVHPVTVIIGLIGGISLFGLPGIFVGPIILSLLLTYFEDFAKSYN